MTADQNRRMELVLVGQKKIWHVKRAERQAEHLENLKLWINQVKAHHVKGFLEHEDIESRYIFFFAFFTIINVGMLLPFLFKLLLSSHVIGHKWDKM